MGKTKVTYNEAVLELEKILFELENSQEIDMEAITEKVKKAGELMAFCKKKLHEIDGDLAKMMEHLND